MLFNLMFTAMIEGVTMLTSRASKGFNTWWNQMTTFLTPQNKYYLVLTISILNGLVLLLGTIPFINWTISTTLFGILTLGQLLGISSFVIAYLTYKKQLR